jgi:zinc transport system permease protein
MGWLAEPLSHPFMQRALLAGVVIAATCAMLGVMIVQRRMSLLSDGLAHASFGGIGLTLLLGASAETAPWAALPFTVAVALSIGALQRFARVGGDAAIAILLSVSFALGVLFLGLRPASAPPVDVESLLFGSVLAISPGTLRVVLAVSLVALAVLAATWTRLAYVTFDRELAAVSGVRAGALEAVLLALTAVVVLTAIQVVGVILVGSFIVMPAVTAGLWSGRLRGIAAGAAAIGIGGCAIGLLASYHLNVATGATIILTLAIALASTLAWSALTRR